MAQTRPKVPSGPRKRAAPAYPKNRPRKGAVRIDGKEYGDMTCPVCGAGLNWACASGAGSVGSVHCQDGCSVSRRLPGVTDRPCMWTGTKCYRVKSGSVWVDMPLPTEVFPF